MNTLWVTLMLMGSIRSGPTVVLSWDPNLEADLAGYRLYYSTVSFQRNRIFITPEQAKTDSLVRTQEILVPSTVALVDSLVSGKNYYFRLTAYDSLGMESTFNVDEYGQDVEVEYQFVDPALAVDSLKARIKMLELWNGTLRNQIQFLDKRQVQQAVNLDKLLGRIRILEAKTQGLP